MLHRGGVHKNQTEFSQISEIRALMPPNTNLMVLTTTASLSTRKSITESLEVTEFLEHLPHRGWGLGTRLSTLKRAEASLTISGGPDHCGIGHRADAA